MNGHGRTRYAEEQNVAADVALVRLFNVARVGTVFDRSSSLPPCYAAELNVAWLKLAVHQCDFENEHRRRQFDGRGAGPDEGIR